MFNENEFQEQLRRIIIPDNSEQIRFDPETPNHIPGQNAGIPTMYLLNSALTTHFYSTENSCFLSLDINEDISYIISWWYFDNKFTATIADMNEMISEDTLPIRDTVRIGTFHETEEEHFQAECLKGTPLSWETEQLVQKKLKALADFYMELYYNDYVLRGKKC